LKIKNVGIAGSGTMGAGIAIVAARAGFKTIIYDTHQDALDRARKQTAGFFAKSVERKKLTPAQVEKIMGDLTGTTRIGDMAGCDIVIEAVFETSRSNTSCSANSIRSVRRTRCSRPTLRRCRLPRLQRGPGATTVSSECISACRRN